MVLQQIRDTLGDCKHLETSNCTNCDVKSSYVTINDKKFFVYDSKNDEPVRVVPDGYDHQLIVVNNTDNVVTLLKTDDCLFNHETKKCDCIVLNDTQCFLVEIKSCSRGTKGTMRQEAKRQLAITIQLLRESNIDISNINLEARICFRGGANRPTQASYNTMRYEFLSQHGVMLDEGNTITFS